MAAYAGKKEKHLYRRRKSGEMLVMPDTPIRQAKTYLGLKAAGMLRILFFQKG
jgi:hypothetical protein